MRRRTAHSPFSKNASKATFPFRARPTGVVEKEEKERKKAVREKWPGKGQGDVVPVRLSRIRRSSACSPPNTTFPCRNGQRADTGNLLVLRSIYVPDTEYGVFFSYQANRIVLCCALQVAVSVAVASGRHPCTCALSLVVDDWHVTAADVAGLHFYSNITSVRSINYSARVHYATEKAALRFCRVFFVRVVYEL